MEELLRQNGFNCREMYLYVEFMNQDEKVMSVDTIEIDSPEKLELLMKLTNKKEDNP